MKPFRRTSRSDSASADTTPLGATGGSQRLALEIKHVRRETTDSLSLSFEVASDFAYAPGQFLTLQIPCSPDESVARCYSFSSSPGCDPMPTVTVKRIAGGRGSQWLHDNAVPGMRINALRPAGVFGPRSWHTDLVLVAAGSGITPMMSIIKTALAQHHQHLTLVYANKSRESIIFADRLAELGEQYPDRFDVHHWIESEAGLPSRAGLASLPLRIDSASEGLLCGPEPFMNVAEDWLRGFGDRVTHLHREVFASFSANPFDDPGPVPASTATSGEVTSGTVELDGVTTDFDWPKDTKLLDRLLELGLDPPYVCREGTCGGCACTVTEGAVTMAANETLDDYEIDQGVRLACQSTPDTGAVHVVFDR
ncbi:ferredoxin--NADP reductase [Rhodococcus sp. I2R]|uniref:ferredoxin--NADP reductase n=1 Tax=Rhodococcus sp. I2R TaxID=2855445 RepID=UPI001E4E73B3|nr:ferredoxin--NADP reductase [Rhodococcus sp. I2R]MCC8928754.1 ferredoxin--NADP reductase [Rhodococcus sp. I2R]